MGSPTEEADDHFQTEHLTSDLKGRSVRGGAITMGTQGVRFALKMGALVVLARLLTPRAYGLLAMVTAVTSLIEMFKNLGLSMATVQRAEVHHGQINALFWINVLLGIGATTLTAAAAPLVTWFYGEPALTDITIALSGAIFLSSLAVQHQALLQRQMRFAAMAVADIVGLVSGIGAAVATAWLGAGYWALVLMRLVQTAVRTGITWMVCRWRPSRPSFGGEGVRSMLSFGGHLTGFRFLNYFARNADDVLIGRYIGSASLGLYNQAYKLLLAPLRLIRTPVSNVVLPALSRLQNEPTRYRAYTRQALAAITFLCMPIITFLFAEAHRVVLLVLGPQWIESAEIFRILAVVALIQSFNLVNGWSYQSLGQTDRWLHWGIFYSAAIITSFAVGLQWGVQGVAMAYTLINYALLLPSFAYCFKTSMLRISDVFSAVWKPAVAALAAAAAAILLSPTTIANAPAQLAGQLALSGVLFGTVYFLSWLLLPGGRAYLAQLLTLTRHVVSHSFR